MNDFVKAQYWLHGDLQQRLQTVSGLGSVNVRTTPPSSLPAVTAPCETSARAATHNILSVKSMKAAVSLLPYATVRQRWWIDLPLAGQCLRCLTGPVLTPLGGPSVCAAWRRAQCLSRLAASPVFVSLGDEASVYLA